MSKHPVATKRIQMYLSRIYGGDSRGLRFTNTHHYISGACFTDRLLKFYFETEQERNREKETLTHFCPEFLNGDSD